MTGAIGREWLKVLRVVSHSNISIIILTVCVTHVEDLEEKDGLDSHIFLDNGKPRPTVHRTKNNFQIILTNQTMNERTIVVTLLLNNHS